MEDLIKTDLENEVLAALQGTDLDDLGEMALRFRCIEIAKKMFGVYFDTLKQLKTADLIYKYLKGEALPEELPEVKPSTYTDKKQEAYKARI